VLFTLFSRLALLFATTNVLDFFALTSLVFGVVLTLKQTEIKRFLAYSSITHVGFLLLADHISFYVYLITYVLASLIVFLVLLTLQLYNNQLVYFNDLRFVKTQTQIYSFLFLISFLSMAGIPPFAGFYGKFLIWLSLIEDAFLFNNTMSYFLLVVSVALSLLISFYYIRLVLFINVCRDNSSGDSGNIIAFLR